MQGGEGEGEALQRAVDLYRGPFLAGFSLPASPEFEAWVTQERYAAERRYLEALAALMDRRAASGEYASAIACARRYLETDDLAEEVHRRLIELYAAAGDRSAALRQFERCAVILERELGVSPLPETRAVYQAVLAHQPLPEQTAPLAWATLPSLHVPLVGRDEALRQLERAYARVQAGRGEVVLIAGEAGIGKSRLMQEFAASCADRPLILAGAGHPDTQTIPYQPVIEALRPALTVRPVAGNLQPVWLAEASRLLPELRSLYPDLPPPLPAEPEEARGRLFEALYQIVLGLAPSPLTPFAPSPLSSRERGEGVRGSGARSLLLSSKERGEGVGGSGVRSPSPNISGQQPAAILSSCWRSSGPLSRQVGCLGRWPTWKTSLCPTLSGTQWRRACGVSARRRGSCWRLAPSWARLSASIWRA